MEKIAGAKVIMQYSFHNKKIIYRTIRTTVLFLILSSCLFAASGEDCRFTIVKATGDVSVLDAKKHAWGKPVLPHRLNEDDVIKTSSGAACEIEFNGSRIKIKEDSQIIMKSLDYCRKLNLNLAYGEILVKLKKIPKESAFEIETPQAIAGARGTRYKVRAFRNTPLTRVSVLQETVVLQSRHEPDKYVSVLQYEQRDIAPWESIVLKAEGKGILSEKILGDMGPKNAPGQIPKSLSEKDYTMQFGAFAKITTKRAAVTDAYRNLAEKIYGVVINSKTTVRDYAAKNDTITVTVRGLVKGAREIDTVYYDDGAIAVTMRLEGLKIKSSLVPLTGDIYGSVCIPGPNKLKKSDFEKFLL